MVDILSKDRCVQLTLCEVRVDTSSAGSDELFPGSFQSREERLRGFGVIGRGRINYCVRSQGCIAEDIGVIEPTEYRIDTAGTQRLSATFAPDKAGDGMASLEEPVGHSLSDVSGGTSYEDMHCFPFSMRGCSGQVAELFVLLP
jgi:hypothetical protein